VRLTELIVMLWAISERAGREADAVRLPKARQDPRKKLCALFAYQLVLELSSRRPTCSANGPFLSVAALLCELLTGEPEANMEASCRSVYEQL
jgi:hypothetical protein